MKKRKLRPSRRARADALRLLHQVVTDHDAATHARVTAARTIINDGRRNEEPDDSAAADEWPPIVCLPDNDRADGAMIGAHRDDRGRPYLLIYRNDEAGLAERDRLLDELNAEWRAAHPEALPEPERPPALTNAQRQARWRERRRAERASLLAMP